MINERRNEGMLLPIQRHIKIEFSAQDINESAIECIPSNSETYYGVSTAELNRLVYFT